MAKFELLLDLQPHAGAPNVPVHLQVDMEGSWEGGFPVWFTLYRGDEIVAEQKIHCFACTEPGTYHVVGMIPNGTKRETQTIEVTPGMVASAKATSR